MEILLKAIIIYLFCATLFLLNLLFNPYVKWEFVNLKTGERKQVPSFYTIWFCLYWIVTIPIILFQRGKNNEPRN